MPSDFATAGELLADWCPIELELLHHDRLRTAPVMILMSVDLPAPFSPINACTSPVSNSNEIALAKHLTPVVRLVDVSRPKNCFFAQTGCCVWQRLIFVEWPTADLLESQILKIEMAQLQFLRKIALLLTVIISNLQSLSSFFRKQQLNHVVFPAYQRRSKHLAKFNRTLHRYASAPCGMTCTLRSYDACCRLVFIRKECKSAARSSAHACRLR